MDKTHSQSQGSVLGGILLISGCCIGAGMLGLPVISAVAGFQPSVFMFLIGWMFMCYTGLLFLEVNLHFVDDVNIVSMANHTLGWIGKTVAWAVFLFLFYCLMVAYVSGGGTLFSDFFRKMTGIHLPASIGSIICSVVLGIFLYFGTQATDMFNRILMAGLIGTYVTLVIVGSPHIDFSLLQYKDWSKSLSLLPIMIVSFGYHNLIPSLTTYLKRDAKRLKTTIIVGSVIPLFVYLIWEILILGLVPVEGVGGFKEALDNGQMATQVLKSVSGAPWVVNTAQYFAFFAIVTSFVGVALSFVDFLSDGLGIKKTSIGKVLLCFLVLVPPLVIASAYPHLFLMALNYAGGIGAVILFGILPAAMVWSGRYQKRLWHSTIAPGGKGMLIVIILFSCLVVALQMV